MTAALELLSPELRAALDAIVEEKVKTQLALVPPPPPRDDSGLSMLAASIRRRDCERRQRDAARAKRSRSDPSELSDLPGSVRTREWRRRQATAKKAAIASEAHVVQGEARDQKHAEVRGTSEATGPLAGTVASILGRTYGSTNLRLRKAYQAIRTGVGIGSKGQIQLGEMWAKTSSEKADARLLVEEFTIPQIKEVAVSVGATWKPDAKSPRVTVGLVLSRLVALRDGSGPAKRRATKPPAPAVATAPTKSAVVDSRPGGPVGQIHAPEVPSGAHGHGTNPGEGISTGGDPEQRPRETIRQQPAGPPLPASSPPPIGPRDLRGTPPREVRGKIAEILEQLEQRRGGGPP